MNKSKIPCLQNAYANLSTRYRLQKGERSIQTPLEAEAYDEGRAPATVAVLKTLLPFLNPLQIDTVLDIGSGTGAAFDALSSGLSEPKWHLVEPNPSMRARGKKKLAEFSPTWHKSLHEAPPGDLVILSYVLNEIPRAERLDFLMCVWVKVKKTLLITLAGTPLDYTILMEARTFFLQQGARLIAPCPHSKSCPLQESDWCHFSVRLPRSPNHRTIKKGTKPFEDEKYCYLVLQRSKMEEKEPPSTDARLIKAPRVRKGHVLLDLCQPLGNKETLAISRKNPSLFRRAHAIKWGMVWSEEILKETTDD